MNKHPGIIGTKLGMTQIFLEDGTVVPCTVVQGGCVVVGKRTEETDGYSALILGLGARKPKRTPKAQRVASEKAGMKVTPRVTRELRLGAKDVAVYEVGQELKLEDIFTEGQYVDVQSRSKGSGHTGVMVRWNMKGATKTHGTHEWRRHGGSIGTNMTPGRTWPGRKMSGQHGNTIVSVLNQRVCKIFADKQLLLIEGTVPGAKTGVVRVQGAAKRGGGKKKGE